MSRMLIGALLVGVLPSLTAARDVLLRFEVDGVPVADGTAVRRTACDGACTVMLRVCVPDRVTSARVAVNGTPLSGSATLVATGRAGCGAATPLVVSGGRGSSRAVVRGRVRTAQHRGDRDRIVIVCEVDPRDAACRPTTTTTSTTTTTTTRASEEIEPPTTSLPDPAPISTTTTTIPMDWGGCVRSGCSSELCADRSYASPCWWAEGYECLKFAECGRVDGACRWIVTPEAAACLGPRPYSLPTVDADAASLRCEASGCAAPPAPRASIR